MGDTFHFWTHGVSVVPEFTKEYTGTNNGLFLQRAGWGATVRQTRGTDNWFHFAIPSPTWLDDDEVYHPTVWVRVKVNNGAVIDQVRVHEATGSSANSPIIFDSGPINITGQDTQLDFNPGGVAQGPLVICVHARFDDESAEIIFAGAGGWFEET